MSQSGSIRALHAAQILWPAFLVAAVLEMVVFAVIDPAAWRWGDWQPDVQTVYSLTFLVFWTLVTLASWLSHVMMKAEAEARQHDGTASPVPLTAKRIARHQA